MATELWNTTEVAAYLGVKVGTVSAYRHRGQMPEPIITVGARTHLWDAAAIRAWRQKGEQNEVHDQVVQRNEVHDERNS